MGKANDAGRHNFAIGRIRYIQNNLKTLKNCPTLSNESIQVIDSISEKFDRLIETMGTRRNANN